jgi:hypothetical protein
MYDIITAVRERFAERGLDKDDIVKLTVGYGHVGDSNIHVNIIAKAWDQRVEEALEPWIYQWVGK